MPKTDDAGQGGDVPMGVGDAEGDVENQEVGDAPCKALGVGKIATYSFQYFVFSNFLFGHCGVLFPQGAARTTEAPVPILVHSVWLSLAMTIDYFPLFVETLSPLRHKDPFYLKLPNKTVSNDASHLPDHLAKMCARALQKTINPHRQRLLAASKRVAKVETAAGEAPSEAKPAKAKAKAKAKGKASAKSKAKAKATAKVKAVKVSVAEIREKAQKDYNEAKKSFMEKFLDYKQFHQTYRHSCEQMVFNVCQPMQCVNMLSDACVVVFCFIRSKMFDQPRLTSADEKISRAEKEKRPFFGLQVVARKSFIRCQRRRSKYIASKSKSHSCA